MIRFSKDGSFSLTYRSGEPFIQWNHMDGPLLVRSDGQVHWLTWGERISVRLGLTDAKRLDPSWVELEGGE
jgi:hypothetical protein